MNNLSLNETIENVGGLEFFFKHLGIYLPYTVLTGLGTIAGIIGKSVNVFI